MRDRILRLRRARREAGEGRQPPPTALDSMEMLEQRVVHLERMVEGLQDAVHREIKRHNDAIDELRKRVEPGEMSRALSEDARERGL